MSERYIGGIVYNPPAGWSAQFNGSNYLSAPGNAAFNVGSGDFCIEAWVNATSSSTGPVIFGVNATTRSTNNDYGIFFGIASNQTLYSGIYYGVVSADLNPAATLVLSTWNHVACVRSSGTMYIYLNGIQIGSVAANVTANFSSSWTPKIGYFNTNSTRYMSGNISNLRVVIGSPVYTTNFTPPTGALLPVTNTVLLTCRYPTIVDGSTNAFTITNTGTVSVATSNPFPTSGIPTPALGNAGNGIYTLSQYATLLAANQWPAIDPYYKNVTLNLHGNAGTVLPFNTDASTNNFQVTQVGDTRPSNYTPFIANGYWSNYFDGSSYLQVAYNSALDAGTGAFTYEAWLNPSTTTNKQYLGGSVTNAFFAFVGSGTIFVGRNNVAVDFTSSSGILTNQWNHVVIVRNASNNIAIFINGVSAYYAASNTNNYGLASNPLRIGVATTGSSYEYNGYISNVRIAKSALYDPTASTITVPTTPLTAGSAGLLTCQSNRFVDNSTNAFAITTSGTPSVNPTQPFTAPTGTSAYGSGFFDGSGDYLTVSANGNAFLMSGDWTLTCWIYPSNVSGVHVLIDTRKGSSSGSPVLYTNGSNLVIDTGSASVISAGTIVANQWQLVAATRSGNSWRLYLNGTQIGSTTTNTTTYSTEYGVWLGNSFYSEYYSGYMVDAQVVNGTALYTGSTYTVPTAPATPVTNTKLLTVQTNAPSQNNTFVDSSTNNLIITRNGNTTQGTFTPYGPNWSNYFDGVSDYLSIADNAAFDLGTGDFTIECWVYHTTASGTLQAYYSHRTNGLALTRSASGYLEVAQDAVAVLLTSTTTVPSYQWVHVAASRSGTALKLFINGAVVGSTVNSTSLTSSNPVYIGSDYSAAYEFTGYISNMRLVKGIAVYTDSFTPSTAPLTAITNTSLLTCQSNRFIDNSSNNFTITRNGDVSVQRFSPFSPTTAYSTSVIGGSGYFDGSGDYLTIPSGAAPTGSGAFTVDFWYYFTATQTFTRIFGGGANTFNLGISSNGNLYYGKSNVANVADGTFLPTGIGFWAHVVVGKNSSNTYRIWVNGVSQSTGTDSYSYDSATNYVGASSSATFPLSGYLSNLRVTNTDVYGTSNTTITVPTAPLTAVSGTQLLLSTTNAGILDNAMMNDLETVGNAQISTSVKKYGTGSMYFDGSGDFLKFSGTQTFGMGTGDWTVEFWMYSPGNVSPNGIVCSAANTSPYWTSFPGAWQITYQSSTTIALGVCTGVGTYTIYTSITVPDNQWFHVAYTRVGTTVRTFINGILRATDTLSSNFNFTSDGTNVIGKHDIRDAYYYIGYIDDFRVTRGVARYTTNFTPPTSQLQDQ